MKFKKNNKSSTKTNLHSHFFFFFFVNETITYKVLQVPGMLQKKVHSTWSNVLQFLHYGMMQNDNINTHNIRRTWLWCSWGLFSRAGAREHSICRTQLRLLRWCTQVNESIGMSSRYRGNSWPKFSSTLLLSNQGDIYQFLSNSHQHNKGLMVASSRNSQCAVFMYSLCKKVLLKNTSGSGCGKKTRNTVYLVKTYSNKRTSLFPYFYVVISHVLQTRSTWQYILICILQTNQTIFV